MRQTLLLSLSLAAAGVLSAADSPLPALRRQGTATQLIVDGRPLFLRSGELGNSTGEPDFLRPSWEKLRTLGLNSLIVPVYWDLLEPEEGKFDFATVDGLLRDARAADMKLVLLWFGTWKNSMSCYAPAWVKADVKRFPRAVNAAGQTLEIVTPFCAEAAAVDARAFAALQRHLKATDAQRTVVLVQVENEIGMINSARDHSAAAEAAWAQPVPAELLAALGAGRAADTLAAEVRGAWEAAGTKTAGTWAEVFGTSDTAEEIFMAWHFARFTERVTAAGKAEYPLPMYANAALIRPAYRPGQYPAAGPLPHLMEVWRAGAPSLDFISPDIYFPNFAEWSGRYVRLGNPLFIPEALRSTDASANVLYAVGQHDAFGFGPFGIESIEEPAAGLLRASYDLLAQLAPVLAEHAGRGRSRGLLPPTAEQRQPHQVSLGGVLMNVSYERATAPSLADGVINESGQAGGRPTLPAGGLVLQLGPDEFLFAGLGVTVVFESPKAGERLGLLQVEEGRYVDGRWQSIRRLNGDQTHQGRHVRLEPGRMVIQRAKLYRY